MKVAIFFGSKSDTEKMKGAANCLHQHPNDFYLRNQSFRLD